VFRWRKGFAYTKTFKYGEEAAMRAFILEMLADPAVIFVFHNALFELAIIKNVLGIEIPPSRVIDTMAKAGYYGYPRGLDEAAKALQCSLLKDLVGKGVMKELATGKWTPVQKPEEFARLYSYCETDVLVTADIDFKLPDLPPAVQKLWELDVEINMRGVPIDVRAIENAVYLKEQLSIEADHRMAQLTNGFVPAATNPKKIKEWCELQGVEMVDCTADTVRRTLSLDLPPAVRQVLELRQEAGLSSVAKYDQMKRRHVNGRLYQEFDHYGAVTGRVKGRGVQLLNLPRTTKADYWANLIHEVPELLISVCADAGVGLKHGLRGMIKASPGSVLVGGDLSQIEARCVGYAADDQTFLDLFRSGDPYCAYGPALWGKTITKADLIERTACKATVLSMGFAGGIGAFQRGAEQYNVPMDGLADFILPNATMHEIESGRKLYFENYLAKLPLKPLTERQGIAADIVKQRFRRDFPQIVAYWAQLWQAFINGGQAGPIFIEKKGNLRILTLPSGRQLFYHDLRMSRRSKYKAVLNDAEQDDDDEDTEVYWSYLARGLRKKVSKCVTIQNIAEGLNYDISSWYMCQANENIGAVVHQCYDEWTMEVPKAKEEWARDQLTLLVNTTQPPWSGGLPIGFEAWSGERYG